MLTRLRLLQLLVYFVFLSTTLRSALIEDFENFSLLDQSETNVVLPGRMYVPPEAASGPRPLILFLHGGGGNLGTNNTSHIQSGNIDNLLAEAKRRGAFLYSPQTATNWANIAITNNVMTMVGRSLSQFAIASDRVYITGLSLGGGGTWNMLSRYGETFAAGVPICGVAPTATFAPANLVDEPLWTFHARNDTTVQVTTTRNNVSNILLAGGVTPPTYPSDTLDFNYQSSSLDLRYTEFATGGHAIWNRVYSTPAMYDWMFARSIPEPTSASLLFSVILFGSRSRRRA